MTDNDKIKLKGMVVEISGALLRISSERELINEIGKRAKAELDIEPKMVKKLGKIYYDQSVQELIQDTDDIVSTYETLFSAKMSD